MRIERFPALNCMEMREFGRKKFKVASGGRVSITGRERHTSGPLFLVTGRPELPAQIDDNIYHQAAASRRRPALGRPDSFPKRS